MFKSVSVQAKLSTFMIFSEAFLGPIKTKNPRRKSTKMLTPLPQSPQAPALVRSRECQIAVNAVSPPTFTKKPRDCSEFQSRQVCRSLPSDIFFLLPRSCGLCSTRSMACHHHKRSAPNVNFRSTATVIPSSQTRSMLRFCRYMKRENNKKKRSDRDTDHGTALHRPALHSLHDDVIYEYSFPPMPPVRRHRYSLSVRHRRWLLRERIRKLQCNLPQLYSVPWHGQRQNLEHIRC